MQCDNLKKEKCRGRPKRGTGVTKSRLCPVEEKWLGSLARAGQLKVSLFGMQHSLGMGNLYQFPAPITMTP